MVFFGHHEEINVLSHLSQSIIWLHVSESGGRKKKEKKKDMNNLAMRNTHTHARTQNLALREPILRLLHSNLHNLHRTARKKNQIDSNVTLNGN